MRTFIAIELSSEIQELITSTQEQLKAFINYMKWVDPHKTHLTLKFLGDTQLIAPIQAALNLISKTSPVFKIETEGLGIFPSLEYPQTFWLGIKQNENLNQLALTIEKSMAQLGIPCEHRSFKAHITLGRFKSKGNLLPLTNIHPAKKSQTVSTITLYQSTLSSTGSIYKTLSQHALVS
jgi:2'-5' RNA ligase